MVEARNRVGGRVICFSDLVPGKNVEGGGELIGSNHPAWLAYAKQFGLSFLDVGEEDLEAPIVLNGKKVTAEQSEQLWEEMEKVFNTIVTDAAKVDADEPWKAAGAEALDKRTLADWINKQGASPLCTSALHTMMMADNGVVTQWQSYLANLAMVKGGGLEKYWTESEVYRCRGGNQQLATQAGRGDWRGPRPDPHAGAGVGADRARRAGHPGLRQGPRGRARPAHRAAQRVEQDRDRSGAAGRRWHRRWEPTSST